MSRKTGITVNTPNHRVFGPGQLYFNYDPITKTGLAVGATAGGSEFDRGLKLALSKPDGALGPVKGFERREEVAPTLKVKLFEMTKDNLIDALAGAVDVGGEITGEEILDGTYISNVTLIAESADPSGDDFIVILDNCLCTKAGALKFDDNKEVALDCTFAAHFDSSTPTTEPWRIIHVPAGS